MSRYAIDMTTLGLVRLTNGKPQAKPKDNSDAATVRKAKALIAKYPQISVERGSDGAYFVTCDEFDSEDESDPLYEEHCVYGGAELLAAVTVYANHLAG